MFGGSTENGSRFFLKKNLEVFSLLQPAVYSCIFLLLYYAYIKTPLHILRVKNGLRRLKCTSWKRLHNPTAVRLQQ